MSNFKKMFFLHEKYFHHKKGHMCVDKRLARCKEKNDLRYTKKFDDDNLPFFLFANQLFNPTCFRLAHHCIISLRYKS